MVKLQIILIVITPGPLLSSGMTFLNLKLKNYNPLKKRATLTFKTKQMKQILKELYLDNKITDHQLRGWLDAFRITLEEYLFITSKI